MLQRRAKKPLPKSKRQYVKNYEAQALARDLEHKRVARFPKFVAPALATLVDAPPTATQWVHENKFNGYRLQLHLQNGQVRFFTRRGNDWSRRFGPLVTAAWQLEADAAVIDGEVVVQAADGTTDFGALQADLGESRTDRLVFFAFDLLYIGRYDIRAAPLLDRKLILETLFETAKEPLRYSKHFEADDAEKLFADACELGLEGLVSKRADSAYRSGRSTNWVKVTCRNRDTFYAIGIASKAGKFDGVYLARRDGDALVYAGKVERGFSDAKVKELKQRLKGHEAKRQPLTTKVAKPKAQWFEPTVLVDVEYRALTGARKLRHPSYKGIREDLIASRRKRAKRGG